MKTYTLILTKKNDDNIIYKKEIKVDSKYDLGVLEEFLSAGIEAFEDWKVEGD